MLGAILLLIEEIPFTTTRNVKKPINTGIFTTSTLLHHNFPCLGPFKNAYFQVLTARLLVSARASPSTDTAGSGVVLPSPGSLS